MTPAYVGSAAAPALRYGSVPARVESEAPLTPQARKPITHQPSLFASRELPRVVPFETIAPASLAPPPPRAAHATPRHRARKVVAGQQSLEFPALHPARLPEGAIYCDAPVAIPTHRVIAAALDGSMILTALAVFGLIFQLFGAQMVFNTKTLPLFLGVAAVLTLFYRLLWCLADGDTPGMRWARLRLVNFDGQVPSRKQRLFRAASGCLSLLAGGLGLLWSLVDEETLTWHDHISKTFPTPN